MEFSEQALVLKVGRFREIDAWVRLVSPVRGVYTAFAFGGLKSRRRFLGCLDPLNHVRFKVRRAGYRGYHCLTEARLLDAPVSLRGDPNRLGMAVNCLKFFEAVHIGPTGAAEAYALLRDMLGALEAAAAPASLFPMLFRARLAALQGTFPACRCCALCGAPLCGGEAVCHVEAGRLTCAACRDDNAPGVRQRLSAPALALFAAAESGDARDWAARRPDPAAAREFSRAVDLLVRYHMGLAWEQGGFVRT
ncbi:MAG: recombination protein O N-terminal domain-containing protein [Solidesulfovibrio sp.]|uniref:DNA repair protein RecO n=1 Tax=Solidesulfovibrio sp. TaxID=2910990 RepID=UPI002B21D10A|nr:recombination protein O N-terminal domain-containing protein [Solidesulfovibrio sp.]MEA4857849.1 recombination protein O N-terminal domain-containing protein [Solidesulfovibrio sp.]